MSFPDYIEFNAFIAMICLKACHHQSYCPDDCVFHRLNSRAGHSIGKLVALNRFTSDTLHSSATFIR